MCRPNDEMVNLAAARLGVSKDAAQSGAKPVAAIEGAFFFTRGTRGGGRLLVSENLETLFASSGIPPQEQVDAFMRGRRS